MHTPLSTTKPLHIHNGKKRALCASPTPIQIPPRHFIPTNMDTPTSKTFIHPNNESTSYTAPNNEKCFTYPPNIQGTLNAHTKKHSLTHVPNDQGISQTHTHTPNKVLPTQPPTTQIPMHPNNQGLPCHPGSPLPPALEFAGCSCRYLNTKTSDCDFLFRLMSRKGLEEGGGENGGREQLHPNLFSVD
jgi:hypothetical protein